MATRLVNFIITDSLDVPVNGTLTIGATDYPVLGGTISVTVLCDNPTTVRFVEETGLLFNYENTVVFADTVMMDFKMVLATIGDEDPIATCFVVRDRCTRRVRAYSASAGPWSYISWNFGDGTIVCSQNASHEYVGNNVYTITQTVKYCTPNL